MDPSQLDVFIRFSSRPKIVLSSSGVILAANDAAGRLLAPNPRKNSSDLLTNQSVFSFDISVIPNSRPTLRDLDSLFAAAASRVVIGDEQGAAASPQLDLKDGDSNDDESWEEDTSSFWNEEALHTRDQETNVVISRRLTKSRPAWRPQASLTTSSVEARLLVQAFRDQEQCLFFVLTFTRPSSNHLAAPSPMPHPTYADQRQTLDETSLSAVNMKMVGRLIPHCAAILNAQGEVLYLTPSWYEFTGASKEESLGTGWPDTVHPEDRQTMVDAWANVIIQNKSHWTHETRYRMRSGAYRWFLVRAERMKDEEGNVISWYATMLDVNESVLARQQTEQRQQAILRLLAQADVSLWGINQAHDIYLREGALSWSPPHHNEKNTHDTDEYGTVRCSHGDDEITRAVQDILDEKSPLVTIEHKVHDRWYRTRLVADCELGHGEASVNPASISVLGLTIDVTDVKVRTLLQIENEKLVANERAANESTRLKSQFLANVFMPFPHYPTTASTH